MCMCMDLVVWNKSYVCTVVMYMSTVRHTHPHQRQFDWLLAIGQLDDLKSSQAQCWKDTVYMNWNPSAGRQHQHCRSDVERSSHQDVAKCHMSRRRNRRWADICVTCEASSRALLLSVSSAVDSQTMALYVKFCFTPVCWAWRNCGFRTELRAN